MKIEMSEKIGESTKETLAKLGKEKWEEETGRRHV